MFLVLIFNADIQVNNFKIHWNKSFIIHTNLLIVLSIILNIQSCLVYQHTLVLNGFDWINKADWRNTINHIVICTNIVKPPSKCLLFYCFIDRQ